MSDFEVLDRGVLVTHGQDPNFCGFACCLNGAFS